MIYLFMQLQKLGVGDNVFSSGKHAWASESLGEYELIRPHHFLYYKKVLEHKAPSSR